MRTKFQRKLTRETDERVFGCGIGLDPRQAGAETCAGTDGHDPAPSGPLHGGGKKMRKMKRAVYIGGKDPVPILCFDLVDRLADLTTDTASGVHDDQRRVLCQSVGELPDLIPVAQIGRDAGQSECCCR